MADINSELKVGQVVFVLSEKNTIIPVQVVEKINRETLTGDTITFRVICGTDQNKVYDLGKVNGTAYSSLEEIRSVLNKRMVDSINEYKIKTQEQILKVVQAATTNAETWYGKSEISSLKQERGDNGIAHLPLAEDSSVSEQPNLLSSVPSQLENIEPNDDDFIILSDGRKAKIRKVTMS